MMIGIFVSIGAMGVIAAASWLVVLVVTAGSTTPTEAAHGPGIGAGTGVPAILGSLVIFISVGRAFWSTVSRGVATAAVVVMLLDGPRAAGATISILCITVCELMLDALVEVVVAVVVVPLEHVSGPTEAVSGMGEAMLAAGENASNSVTGAGEDADASDGSGDSRAFELFLAASFSFFRKKTCC